MRDDEKKDDIRSTSVVVVATEDPRLERKRFLAVYWVEMKCFKVFGGGGVLGHVKVKRSRKRAEREREGEFSHHHHLSHSVIINTNNVLLRCSFGDISFLNLDAFSTWMFQLLGQF